MKLIVALIGLTFLCSACTSQQASRSPIRALYFTDTIPGYTLPAMMFMDEVKVPTFEMTSDTIPGFTLPSILEED